jgi:iron(III) transport system ATP-binding protein
MYVGEYGLRNLSFMAAARSFVTLLGPSGCGKTTTLRCLAGLIQPNSGSVWFGTRQVNGPGIFVPPEQRGAGMVFQSYALWPHMSVFENIAYGLRNRRVPKASISERVRRTAGRLAIEQLLDRYPSQLSGGQQQRVALARSLVYEPDILLLDEPLSNLDAALRQQMLEEFTDMQRRLGVTTIYVTHNQEEALVMSTEVLLLDKGDLVQAGPPRELFERPHNRFAAEFMGEANFFGGKVVQRSSEKTVVRTDVPGLQIATACSTKPVGEDVTVMVRPHRIDIRRHEESLPNTWAATVTRSIFNGGASVVDMEMFGRPLRVRANDPPAVGEKLWVTFPPENVVLLDAGL